MNALVLTAVLITQTFGGQMHVQENLSEGACIQASCLATEQMTCEAADKRDAELVRQNVIRIQQHNLAVAQWRVIHPKEAANCDALWDREVAEFRAAQTKDHSGPTVNVVELPEVCSNNREESPNSNSNTSRQVSNNDIREAFCVSGGIIHRR
jgi:hypothetical protein